MIHNKTLARIAFLLVPMFLTHVLPASAAELCRGVYLSEAAKSVIAGPPSRDFNARPPTRAEISQYLTAVHATDFIPSNGILTPDGSRETQMFRTTMHFSLGEMVLSHSNGNWDFKKFAVLIPFREIESKVVNIYQQDTFVYGEVKIPAGATILYPLGTNPPNIPGVHFKSYNPQTENLRDVVAQTLKEQNQWVIESTGAAYDDQSMLNGVNVNNARFFQNINKKKDMLWSIAYENPMKAISFQLHDKFFLTKEGLADINQFVGEWIIMRASIEHLLKVSFEVLDKRGLGSYQDRVVEKGFKDLERFLKLIDLEILIQQQYGKTLMGTEGIDAIRMQIFRRLLNEPVDLKMVTPYLSKLVKATKLEDIDLEDFNVSVDYGTRGFSWSELQDMQNKNSKLFNDAGVKFDRFFVMRQYLSITVSRVSPSGLLNAGKPMTAAEKKEIYDQLRAYSGEILATESVERCYQWMFSVTQVPGFVRILRDVLKNPDVEEHLKKNFNMDLLRKMDPDDPEFSISEAYNR